MRATHASRAGHYSRLVVASILGGDFRKIGFGRDL